MNPLKQLQRTAKGLAIVAGLLASHAHAADEMLSAKPGAATQPIVTTETDVQEAKTRPSGETMALLTQIDAAYAKLQSAEFSGRIIGRFDVAGQQKNSDAEFTSAFQSPNFFRHQVKGDVQVGSTGQKAYAFHLDKGDYTSADAPKARADLIAWPMSVVGILQEQNPSMLLAITKSAADQLKDIGDGISRVADTTVDSVACPTLRLELPTDQVLTLLVDPRTFLLRQARFDYGKLLAKRGTTDVKNAEVVVDYTHIATDVAANDARFAWTPPLGATLASSATSSPSNEELNPAAAALVGKRAEDFTLADLNDKPMKLSDLKGSVVLLDFWATWCPPCVLSMPHRDELLKENAARGLKVYAIDRREEKNDVKDFVQQQKWTLPILLDPQGDAARLYSVDSLPQAVLIGKDGIIKKVYLIVDDETEMQIKSDVATELAR